VQVGVAQGVAPLGLVELELHRGDRPGPVQGVEQQPQQRELFGDPDPLGQQQVALGADPVEVGPHPVGGGPGGPPVQLIAEAARYPVRVENPVRPVKVVEPPVDLVPEALRLVGLVHVGAGHPDDLLPGRCAVAELFRVGRDEEGPLLHPALGEVVGQRLPGGGLAVHHAAGLLGQQGDVHAQVVPPAAVPDRVP